MTHWFAWCCTVSLLAAPVAEIRPGEKHPLRESLMAVTLTLEPIVTQVLPAAEPRKPASLAQVLPLAPRWSLEATNGFPEFMVGKDALYLRDHEELKRVELETAKVTWSSQAEGGLLREVEGRVFLMTKDFKIICLDAATGGQLWSSFLEKEGSGSFFKGNINIIQSALKGPVLAGTHLLFGTFGGSLFRGTTGKLYALDLATGKQEWAFTAEDGVENLPVVEGSRVYFGGKAACYALDLATGEPFWHASTRSDNQWSFKLVDGTVLVSSGHFGSKNVMFGGTLYAFKAATGVLAWKFDIGGPSIISVAQGIVTGLEWGAFGGTRLTGIHLATGEKAWELKEKSSAIPAVLGGRAVHLNKDNQVFVVDLATGKTTGSFKAAGDFRMGFFKGPWGRFMDPGVLEGEVIVGSWDQQRQETVMQCVELDKGAPNREVRIKGELEWLHLGDSHCLILVREQNQRFTLKVLSR